MRTIVVLLVVAHTGSMALWCNFVMLGSRSFEGTEEAAAVRPVLTVDQLMEAYDDAGETHPYAMAYDPLSDTLVTSFKDDWGAFFPRFRATTHNMLVLCNTLGDDRNLRRLTFGPQQVPENIVLRPSQPRGWVNVLDMRHRSYHVAAFRYDDHQVEQTAFVELPVEPNYIIDDEQMDRLLVIGILFEVLVLDPDTLQVISRHDLFPLLFSVDGPDPGGGLETSSVDGSGRSSTSAGKKIPPRPLAGELCIVAARFDEMGRTVYLGTMGRYVRAFLVDGWVPTHRASAPGMVLGFDGGEGELLATQPLQRSVLVLDEKSLEVVQRLPVGFPARPVARIPGSRWIVTGSYSGNRSVVVDRRSGEITTTFRLGRLQRDAVPDPTRKRVFLATGLGLFEIDGDKL